MPTNLERMIKLAVETFDAHNDPEQLDVDEKVIKHLHQLNPSAVSQRDDGNGPIAWLLLIPTTSDLMNQFIEQKISESDLLYKTPLNIKYDALYLCSVMVLDEYRKKGIASQLAYEAIKNIRADHPIHTLFTWNFSKEGEHLADSIAVHEALPLLKRKRVIR